MTVSKRQKNETKIGRNWRVCGRIICGTTAFVLLLLLGCPVWGQETSLVPHKVAPSEVEQATFPKNSCLQVERERDDEIASHGRSVAFCMKIYDSYCIVCADHALTQKDGSPVDLHWILFVTPNGKRFALDDGRDSVKLRRAAEKKGLVKPVDFFVKLRGRAVRIGESDAAIFRLQDPVPGLIPLEPLYSTTMVKEYDQLKALVANPSVKGEYLQCTVEDPDCTDEAKRPRFQFYSASQSNKFMSGDSGAPILNSENRVVGMLLQIQKQELVINGVHTGLVDTVEYGGSTRLVSSRARAVGFDRILPALQKYWGVNDSNTDSEIALLSVSTTRR